METKQYAIPPNTVIDLAFQYNKENLNLHINTITGLIVLHKVEDKENPVFIKII